MKKVIAFLLVVNILSTCGISFASGNNVIHGIISKYDIKLFDYFKPTTDYSLDYPQVIGLSDKEKQVKINKEIKDYITEGITVNDIINSYSWYNSESRIVWKSDNLLCITSYLDFMGKSAAHPNIEFNTINIDIKTGKVIKLSDVFKVNSDFRKLFSSKSQVVFDEKDINLTGKEGKNGLNEFKKFWFTSDELENQFVELPEFINGNVGFYFTSTGMVFVYATNFASGNYQLFTLNYNELEKFIKKSPQWSDISVDFPNTYYQIILNQSFKISYLLGSKSTYFVSGCDLFKDGLLKSLKFCLIDNKGNVSYKFPSFFNEKLCSDGFQSVDAVAFIDVNGDGKKDVIILAKIKDVVINEKLYNEDVAGIYLQNNKSFVLSNDLNNYINYNIKPGASVSDIQRMCITFVKNHKIG